MAQTTAPASFSGHISRPSAPTIALFSESLQFAYSASIWQGVREAVSARQANLYCVIGGELQSMETLRRQGNVLYELIGPDNVQGIVFLATVLGPNSKTQEILAFYQRYAPLPVVSIGLELQGHSCVLVDNYAGMYAAVEHLIVVHRCRRIACIRGPEQHQEADLRYQAYANALHDHDLPIAPELVAFGNFLPISGEQAIATFMDQRKLTFDALVAANDNMALAASQALQRRGLRVPQDVAVVGFDDFIEAQCADPPMTTVRQPVREMAFQAVDLLLEHILNDAPPTTVSLPTRLITRESCGCHVQHIASLTSETIAATPHPRRRNPLRRLFSGVFSRKSQDVLLRRDLIAEVVQTALRQCADLPLTAAIITRFGQPILEALYAEIDAPQAGPFLSAFQDVLRTARLAEETMPAWQNAVTLLRASMLPTVRNQHKTRAENCWHQTRLCIGAAALRSQLQAIWEKDQEMYSLRRSETELTATLEIERLMQILPEELPNLRISCCYVALYESTLHPTGMARLILAYHDRKMLTLPEDGQRFPARQLLPEEFRPSQTCYRLMMEPLYFHEEQLGFILFSDEASGEVYDILSSKLSSALNGSRLLKARKQAEDALEQTLDTLRHEAGVVSSNSQQNSARIHHASQALEEVAANIQQVSSKVTDVMAIVNDAVGMAAQASAIMTSLDAESQEIGDITKLITTIAKQTNLLALNAHIEAAQAGDHGRGFMVVAGEVKNLARETSKSAEDIVKKIKTIQTSSQQAVEAIMRVSGIIRRVSELSQAIVIAISDQTVSTNEVSRLIIELSKGSDEIARAITALASAALDPQDSA